MTLARQPLLSWALLVVATILVACGGGTEPSGSGTASPAAGPESTAEVELRGEEIIVFSAPVGEAHELFALDTVDGARRQLTSLGRFSGYPAWSPDGETIAFLSMTEESGGLMLLDPSTGEIQTLLEGYGEPVGWAPDGRLLVARFGDPGGLYLLDPSDGTESTVETGSDRDAYARWARAAPMLAYESSRDGNPEIYVTWVESGETSRLTENDHLDEWPAPSPDGEWIAWASGTEEDKNLWVMRSDGSEMRQLTEGMLFGDAAPEWSPDARQILFTVNENDQPVLKLIDVESGTVTGLGVGMGASWQSPA